MMGRNQNSHLRATETIDDWLKAILKAVIVKLIADKIYKYGKVAYDWSKPSLVEFKNRAEFGFHYMAFIIGIESPLTFMFYYYKLKLRGKSLLGLLACMFLGLCLSSKTSKSSKLLRLPNML